MIIHGSLSSVIVAPGGGGPPPGVGKPTAVLRDWVGHEEDINLWTHNRDLQKANIGNLMALEVNLPGPYDINNQCHVIDGDDYYRAQGSDLGWSSDPFMEVTAWVLLDDLPTVASEQTLGFFWIYNIDNDLFIGVDFVVQPSGDVYLEVFHGQNGFSRFAIRSSSALTKNSWNFITAAWDHNTLGNNLAMRYNAGAEDVGRPDGGIPASTYDEVRLAPQHIGANEQGFKFSNLTLGRNLSSPANRAAIRGFTTQLQYDNYLRSTFIVQRYYRCTEYELGVSIGDRYIHDVSGQLHPGTVPTGTLLRGFFSPGPLDYATSHAYKDSAIVSHDLTDVTVTGYQQSIVFFFRQSATFSTNNSWFLRLEDDAGGYVELERRTDGPSAPDFWRLRFRLHPSDGSADQVVNMDLTPMFDTNWHRVAWTMGPADGDWKVLVDGIVHMGALPLGIVPAQLGQPLSMRYGNIELNMAGLGFVDALDTHLYTIFTNVLTQQALRDYCQDRNYKMLAQMQNTITGAIP